MSSGNYSINEIMDAFIYLYDVVISVGCHGVFMLVCHKHKS